MTAKNKNIERLIGIIKHLRSPEGCPWDKKQTHVSLKPLMIEEVGELLDAIDNKDFENLREELGDLLMHIILHSIIAEENKEFTFDDVIEEISEKMLRRHPHIFGDKSKPDNADEVVILWEEIKAQENKHKKRISFFDGIPKNLPGLLRAEKIQKKAAKVGFDWRTLDEVIDKLDEEVSELKAAILQENCNKIEEELGDILFSAVNIARFRNKTSTEEIMSRSTDKFVKRFHNIEKQIKENNKEFSDYSIDDLEVMWQNSKRNI